MQAFIEEANNQRLIVLKDGENKRRMRIATVKRIKSMSNTSLRNYKKKIGSFLYDVHRFGTPQAIRAIDYLKNKVWAEYSKRTKSGERGRGSSHPSWRKDDGWL